MSYSVTETTLRRAFGTPTSYGTVASPATGQISAQEIGAEGSYRGIRLSLTNVPIAITNANEFGSADLWTFVAGSLDISNACVDLTVQASAGIPQTTSALAMSLGTAATADTTLSGAEANAVASTTLAALVAGAGTFRAGANTSVSRIGGITAQTLRLNAALTGNVMTADATLTVSGTIDVYFTLARAFA
jgi:hypothetical protein